MTDETFISEPAAMRILRHDGDFTDCQARIVLNHSRKQSIGGDSYYPMRYVYKRARDNAAKPEPNAWAVATPISEPATVAPVSAEYEAPQSAPETQEADAPATLAAPEPAIALREAVAVPNDATETMPDHIADVMARLERLERAIADRDAPVAPSGAMETVAPLSVQSKPKRSPAHIRAIMAYVALRRERVRHSDTDDRCQDYAVMANNLGLKLHDAKIELDQLRKSLETVQADSIRWQQQDAAREKADYAKRRRALLSARVRSQAAWQLGRALLTSVDECERLKRVAYQQAGHIINLGERVDKAEQMLKTSGYWPQITVTAPDVIRMPQLAH